MPTLLFILIAPAVACTAVDPVVAFVQAQQALLEARQPDAVRTVSEALNALPCADREISSGTLASLYAIGAVASSQVGDRSTADRWLAEAERLDPAVAAVISPGQERGAVSSAVGAVRARSPVRIDGTVMRGGNTLSLPAGPHLVQYRDERAKLQSQVVEVHAGTTVLAGPAPRGAAGRFVGVAMLGAGTAALVGSAAEFLNAGQSADWTYSHGYGLGGILLAGAGMALNVAGGTTLFFSMPLGTHSAGLTLTSHF